VNSVYRPPEQQPFDAADLVVDLEDRKIPSFMAESGNNIRTTSPPQKDAGEVSSREAPPSPNRAVEIDAVIAEANASASKTSEKPI
jgi:hypothetical protein